MMDERELEYRRQLEQEWEAERRREHELKAQRARFEEDQIGAGLDETGKWPPRECVVCGKETRLRCAGCRAIVCHLHEKCPNGCDDARVGPSEL
jgi:hypothetical protein